MKLVPQLLYNHKNVRKIMVNGLSCIVHKTIDTIDTNKDHYVAAHVLSVVLKGQLNIETYYEFKKHVATQHQLVLIPKGRYMISDIVPEGGEFEAVFFFFEDDLIKEFMASKRVYAQSTTDPCYLFRYTEKIKKFTASILEIYGGDNQQDRNVLNLKLLELFHLIYNSPERDNFINLLSSLRLKKKRSIEELMTANFDKPLSIEDYAFLAGRSVATFNRDFKRLYGMSPKKWLIAKRMEKARALLLSSTSSVSEVALEAGYESVSHFIASFGKYFGTSPKQLLILNRQKSLNR